MPVSFWSSAMNCCRSWESKKWRKKKKIKWILLFTRKIYRTKKGKIYQVKVNLKENHHQILCKSLYSHRSYLRLRILSWLRRLISSSFKGKKATSKAYQQINQIACTWVFNFLTAHSRSTSYFSLLFHSGSFLIDYIG